MALMAKGIMKIMPNKPFEVLLSNFPDRSVKTPTRTVIALALHDLGGVLSVASGINSPNSINSL